jgi:hypothetical protein
MRKRARFWSLAILMSPAPAAAQAVVTSAAPETVAVTVYRDPYSTQAELNLRWLNGYALISETRRVSIPAGESDLRFEGVAGGILPQSAILSGVPGAVERNRDAYLLSPGTLLDRSLGRRVHLRRTSSDTGKVVDQEAVVRSGADGAVVLQTGEGFEALRCTGLSETLLYEGVPSGLSAKPTLSVRTRSERAVTAQVTLSYLATGFDWRANYVATLTPGGDRLELRAWLTLASSDETSFRQAQTQAVAGRLNWTGERAPPVISRPLILDCWQHSTTSDIPEQRERILVSASRVVAQDVASFGPPPPPPPPPPEAPTPVALMAEQEALGALKLYRIPEPVTVAAHSQKQVALLARPSVRVRTIYRRNVFTVDDPAPVPAQRILIARNLAADGLGLPLPSGQVVLFSTGASRPILLGQGSIEDRTIGEDVEIAVNSAPGVNSRIRVLKRSADRNDFEMQVTNDSASAIAFEAVFQLPANRIVTEQPLSERNGHPALAANIPANGSTSLRFSYLAGR